MTSKKQVVLITGCSSGIGRSLAIQFHGQKSKYILYATSRKLASMKDLDEMGINTLQIDITNQKEISSGISTVLSKHGRIDMLINNAGFAQYGPMMELSIDDYKKSFEVNFHGTVRMTQSIIPHMMKIKSGSIVTISSISGLFGSPFTSAYCSTKFALNGWMDSIRHELWYYGIKCITVQPGAIKTKLFKNGWDIIGNKKYKYYEDMKECVKKRCFKVETGNNTTADEFSCKLIKILQRKQKNIPNVIKIGKKTWFYPFMNRHVTPLFDFIAREQLGIHKALGRRHFEFDPNLKRLLLIVLIVLIFIFAFFKLFVCFTF